MDLRHLLSFMVIIDSMCQHVKTISSWVIKVLGTGRVHMSQHTLWSTVVAFCLVAGVCSIHPTGC